ncbi:MAG: hypothetical protein LBQ22_01900 [Bacteroidales bacterium]|jgi:hypothetical protein|nr:hypothetical protein [Bacteroidales bacterium]
MINDNIKDHSEDPLKKYKNNFINDGQYYHAQDKTYYDYKIDLLSPKELEIFNKFGNSSIIWHYITPDIIDNIPDGLITRLSPKQVFQLMIIMKKKPYAEEILTSYMDSFDDEHLNWSISQDYDRLYNPSNRYSIEYSNNFILGSIYETNPELAKKIEDIDPTLSKIIFPEIFQVNEEFQDYIENPDGTKYLQYHKLYTKSDGDNFVWFYTANESGKIIPYGGLNWLDNVTVKPPIEEEGPTAEEIKKFILQTGVKIFPPTAIIDAILTIFTGEDINGNKQEGFIDRYLFPILGSVPITGTAKLLKVSEKTLDILDIIDTSVDVVTNTYTVIQEYDRHFGDKDSQPKIQDLGSYKDGKITEVKNNTSLFKNNTISMGTMDNMPSYIPKDIQEEIIESLTIQYGNDINTNEPIIFDLCTLFETDHNTYELTKNNLILGKPINDSTYQKILNLDYLENTSLNDSTDESEIDYRINTGFPEDDIYIFSPNEDNSFLQDAEETLVEDNNVIHNNNQQLEYLIPDRTALNNYPQTLIENQHQDFNTLMINWLKQIQNCTE